VNRDLKGIGLSQKNVRTGGGKRRREGNMRKKILHNGVEKGGRVICIRTLLNEKVERRERGTKRAKVGNGIGRERTRVPLVSVSRKKGANGEKRGGKS